MRTDVMHARVWRPLRLMFFFLATCSALLAIFLALTAIPETGRNPASTDFGWLRSQWLAGFVLAMALLGPAIRIATGWARIFFATLLIVIWGASAVPAYQFWAYQALPSASRP